jgi:hypothetical protein
MSETLEQRVAKIEVALREMQLEKIRSTNVSSWVTETAGCFRGDDDYAEIARLGRELRDAENGAADALNADALKSGD